MAAANTDLLRKYSRRWVGQIGAGGVADASVTTIPLSSTTNLATDTAVTVVIDRVDSSGTSTPSLEETVIGVVSGSNLVTCTRGVEGTAQAHSAGAVVEVLVTSDALNDMIDHLLVGHTQLGAHIASLPLTTPKITTAIHDANGNEVIKTPATSSAVNEITVTNSITACDVLISATGGDTDISLRINPKGAGKLKLGTANLQWPNSDGSANQLLKTDGAGELGFVTGSTIGNDGWTPVSDSWSYASASTVTVPSGAASLYKKGDKVKFTQTTVKYFVITGVADTVLTFAVNTDYVVANAAISAISYSHQDSPIGFPTYFTYAPTWTADSGVAPAIVNGTITGRYNITSNGLCFVEIIVSMGSSSTFGSGGTAYRLDLPVAFANSNGMLFGCHYNDSSTASGNTVGYGEFAATSKINLRVIADDYVYTTTPFTWASGDKIMVSGSYFI